MTKKLFLHNSEKKSGIRMQVISQLNDNVKVIEKWCYAKIETDVKKGVKRSKQGDSIAGEASSAITGQKNKKN